MHYFRKLSRQALMITCFTSIFGLNLMAHDHAGLFSSHTTSDLITFHPNQEFERVVLTLSGPDGLVFSQEFSGLNVPFLEVIDANGNLLADGPYSYELRAVPKLSSAVKDVLRASRESGDYAAVNDLRQRGEIPNEAMAFSGHFQVQNGYILDSNTPEPKGAELSMKSDGRADGETPGKPTPGDDQVIVDDPADLDDSDLNTRDQVILDDLIVDGSACIGFDCVNGESFSFDTIRLKENNLRIKFLDTSVGSFPSTDWQLTANASANGGANKFSIDDITGGRTPFTVEGNAPNNALYVDDGGRLGLGTSIPVADVHIVDGDTPTLRLQQDGSSGFAPQTWDVAGNETSFFIRDATNGSTLPFRIRPGAPSQSLVIGTDGNVGVGILTPTEELHVVGSGLITGTSGTASLTVLEDSAVVDNSRDLLVLSNNGHARFRLDNTDEGGTWSFINRGTNFLISRNGSGVEEFRVDETTGDVEIAGMLTEMSDVNRKKNFEPVDPESILERVAQLPITTWQYKNDESGARHLGPMAQDFAALFGLGKTDTGIGGLDETGVALSAIQGLYQRLLQKEAELEEKDALIEQLMERDEEISNRLLALENLISNPRANQ